MSAEKDAILVGLRAQDPLDTVVELARRLRDSGWKQREIYDCFLSVLSDCDADSKDYDLLQDALDVIWGGGWGKGAGLFDTELEADGRDSCSQAGGRRHGSHECSVAPMTNDDVDIFSYTLAEQATFPYVRGYVRRISPRLQRVLMDPDLRRRYLLAGLFLTYRACTHSGVSLCATTELSGPHRQRLDAFERLTGERIESTDDYLRKLDWSALMRFFPIGWWLYRFVMHGPTIK